MSSFSNLTPPPDDDILDHLPRPLARIIRDLQERVRDLELRNEREDDYRMEQNERD